MSIADIRKEYKKESLSEHDVKPDPYQQFDIWWDEAMKAEIEEVNAMTLATVSEHNIPSARIVLLKGYDQRGFVFFSNYLSRKGLEIDANPNAALLLFWKELERQVRIEGVCEKVSAEESDAYFISRPEGSQIGAWASPQSKVISSRDELADKITSVRAKFQTSQIPRPPHWGGYRVIPHHIEFWQGRPSRLHDRIRYRMENNVWVIERLAP